MHLSFVLSIDFATSFLSYKVQYILYFDDTLLKLPGGVMVVLCIDMGYMLFSGLLKLMGNQPLI